MQVSGRKLLWRGKMAISLDDSWSEQRGPGARGCVLNRRPLHCVLCIELWFDEGFHRPAKKWGVLDFCHIVWRGVS